MAPTPSTSNVLNSNDHGPAIIIAAGISLCTTSIALALRLHQKWPWTQLVKVEDVTLILAYVCDVANVAAIGLAVHYGLGKRADRLSTVQVERTTQALIAGFAVTFLTEALAAVSSLALLRSMTANKRYRQLMIGFCVVVMAWSLAGVVRLAAASNPDVAPLDRATWIGFAVVEIVIQVALFASAMWTIWGLQMIVSRKIGVSLWFTLCIPVAVVAAVRLVYTPEDTFSPNFTWKDINMVIIGLVESNLAILNAAYPSVRQFLTKVSTGFLVAERAKDSKSGSKSNSYALQTISGTGSKPAPRRQGQSPMNLDRTSVHHATTVKGDTKRGNSFGSEVIMVRRSVEIDEVSVPES